jgi:hypothetical protein
MFFLRIDILHVMSQVLAIRGALPGMFACDIRPSRRNSFEHALQLDKELLRKLGILGRTLVPPFYLQVQTECHKMIAGVGLNGRKYKQGDRSRFSFHSPLELDLITTFVTICRHIEIYVDIIVDCRHNTNCVDIYVDRIEYLPRVKRMYNLPGVGGLDGASTSHLIGTIKMFYHFDVGGVKNTFVDILNHPFNRKEGRMYILPTVLSLVQGKHMHPIIPTSRLYHIDSVTSKVIFVPHYNPPDSSTQMCGIPMWESR